VTREAVLDAAEQLFYTRGVQAVGMAEIRTAAGVSLKRLYQLFPSKDELLLAFLDRRDIAWRGRLAAYVADRGDEPLAVFDWLMLWVREPGFRGCAWINVFGELGAVSPAVLDRVRAHKAAFRAYLKDLSPDGDHLMLIFEGATVTAAIMGNTEPAVLARTAAARLLNRPGT
jgi:AcrR family transcriptional regulator